MRKQQCRIAMGGAVVRRRNGGCSATGCGEARSGSSGKRMVEMRTTAGVTVGAWGLSSDDLPSTQCA